MAALDISIFETIVPSRYITFTIPTRIRFAVLDSPSATAGDDCIPAASIAAMFVPQGRESDWIFSTFSGHLQLLHSSSTTAGKLSRLILVGCATPHVHPTSYNSTLYKTTPPYIQEILDRFLFALTPKSLRNGRAPVLPFLCYDNEITRSSVLEICEGPCVGEMLIENVELLEIDGVKEFRRRLRFKRMPNFVQTQVKIREKIESTLDDDDLDGVEFELDNGVLVHPYLSPMVAGLSVISRFLERRISNGIRPKALCLGVGGGALLGFLSAQLNFEVVGVEEDNVVLDVAKRYFGLENNELIRFLIEDGVPFVKHLSLNITQEDRFDVIMVDIDSSDAALAVCAPPPDFVQMSVLSATREVLLDEGVLVINTIPYGDSFYKMLIRMVQEVYKELYEIEVGNGDNFVLIATNSIVEHGLGDEDDAFLKKLKEVVSCSCIDSIRKIPKDC